MSSLKVGPVQEFAAMTPIEREGRSDDIAKLAAFLALGDVSHHRRYLFFVTMSKHSEIHIRQTRLDPSQEDMSTAEAWLGADETRRAHSFQFAKDRRRFIQRHAFLREVVAHYLGLPPAEVPLEIKQNKPPQVTGPASMTGLQLSMSSSDDQAVVSVAWHRRVGVDIERIRPGFEDAGIAKSFFSQAENAHLEALPAARIWARKEAYVKAIGLGLSHDLASFDVIRPDDNLTAKDEVLVNDRKVSGGHRPWLVKDVARVAGFALACCAEGNDWSITYRGDAEA